jgi:tRNA dimethylallyltransferase
VRYSAHQWASDARRWRADARAAGRDAVVVGGTGFYVRALVEPLDDAPSLDPDRRAALEAWLATLGGAELTRWCQRLDPARAALGRTQQRRAVETALLAGRRISASHAHARAEAPTVDDRTRYLVIDPGDAGDADRRARQAMMAAGWVDEVCGLMQRVPADAAAWNASGYRTIREAVAGGGGLERAVDRVIIETRQYAKRQRTWCRHQLPAAAVTALDSRSTDALARARAWWESERSLT